MKVLEYLLKAIRKAGSVNRGDQADPACILWPDGSREWESIVPRLLQELPELLVLGAYDPSCRKGPAIWLRCVLAGTIRDIKLPSDRIPVLYLPGVSRQHLRAIDSCPDPLKPLAELQYRGKIWGQPNTKDWTVMAFLHSSKEGPELDVQGKAVREVLLNALDSFLGEEVDFLREKVLDEDYFGTLVTGGDPVRSLLRWLDNEEVFRSGMDSGQWEGFLQACGIKFAFDPQKEGVLGGAARLAAREGSWGSVWERFCEAPNHYRNIPAQIRRCQPPGGTMVWLMGDRSYEGWPQWNDFQEKELRKELVKLEKKSSNEARERILELEKKHGSRRTLVWAMLGESPLALALEHLSVLAEVTKKNLAFGTLDDLKTNYVQEGWRADDAVLKALFEVEAKDLEPVSVAIRSVYLPWAEESARYLQKLVLTSEYPGGSLKSVKAVARKEGECVLFVDGLRFDTAKRLAASLTQKGCDVSETPMWVPLPSVTATGKAAVSPVRDKIRGEENSPDFEPVVADTGQSLAGGGALKKLLIQNGWQILVGEGYGDGSGNAWCEVGDIDHEGHDRGWKLARHVGTLIEEIRERVVSLLSAGWKSVRIVTDHGWLLLPGGLPKIELSSALVDSKWGRCASLKEGVMTEESLYPWFWNPTRHFVLADGISCFRKGEEYTHGGLSLEECLTLELVVTASMSVRSKVFVKLTDIGWKGFRCTVGVEGESQGLSLDIRRLAGDPSTSVVICPQPFKKSGTASVLVEDEGLEKQAVVLVLFAENGELVAQAQTVVGGEDIHD
ncbi:MAG: BREX-1 system phosphatase PglZ type B [Leptospirales bacterium]